MELGNLTEEDHKLLALWAADCAERVLPYFQAHYPNDSRPQDAIKAARAWVKGELKMTDARKAAFATHAAAREAVDKSAVAAARAAGHAAATAHVVTHAPHAANYAIKALTDIGDERTIANEKRWQTQHLPKHLQALA